MTADRAVKEPCRVSTTVNVNLSGLQTIDGVSLAAGDRVLVRVQNTASENGIWQAASGNWTRATDFAGTGVVVGGVEVFVTSGVAFGRSGWRVVGDGPITVGSDAVNFGRSVGSDSVAFRAEGSTAVTRTVRDRLLNYPLQMEDYYSSSDGANYTPAIGRALDWYAANRVNPPLEYPNWGTGVVQAGRGTFPLQTQLVLSSVEGGGIRGHAQFSTVFTKNTDAVESGIYLEIYAGVVFEDFTLTNLSTTPGASYGLVLQPKNAGGLLTVNRVSIQGFHYGIFITGDIVTGNGDKTLWNQISLSNTIGWSNGQNKQAIGHTFVNFNGGCSEAFFEYGGAGETLAVNGTVNILKSLLKIPENAGTAIGGVFTVQDTKLEYHGINTNEQYLIDASDSVLNADSGGSRVTVRLRGVTVGSGGNLPNTSVNKIIKVGNGTGGSDEIVVQADGGQFEGRIEIASAVETARQTRWFFRDMKLSPNPATVDFVGAGNHPLVEWSNCDGRMDQYRGGEHVNGSIPAEKAYRWHQLSKYVINTAAGLGADTPYTVNGVIRYGKQSTISPGFSSRTTVTGLAVFINVASADDLVVEWFSDPGFASPIGSPVIIPAGVVGLRPIVMNDASKWQVTSNGSIYVRMTKPGTGRATIGDLVIFYYPYFGTE